MEKGIDSSEMVFKTKNGVVKSHLDLTKLYQCSLWHNIIPFATNPSSSSYCGIGFGLGKRDSFVETNSVLIFVSGMQYEYQCVMLSRAIQRHFSENCSKDSKPLYDKCFSGIMEKQLESNVSNSNDNKDNKDNKDYDSLEKVEKENNNK